MLVSAATYGLNSFAGADGEEAGALMVAPYGC
jgi:hypothetical protein